MHWTDEVLTEMARARAQFPSPDLLLTAFSEESGEVVKAVLDHYAGKGDLADVRKELIQVGAMVGRLLEEGDPVHRLPSLVVANLLPVGADHDGAEGWPA